MRQGEHGAPVVFWKWIDTRHEGHEGDVTADRYAMLRYYTVFSISQYERIVAAAVPTTAAGVAPIESAERIVAAMPDAPGIVHGADRPCYRPATSEMSQETL